MFLVHTSTDLFPAMINDWRERWGLGEFPFYFVQIAPYRYSRNPSEMGAELREAQLLTMQGVSNTGMAVTLDIGNPRDIHPVINRRLGAGCLWALRDTYGKSSISRLDRFTMVSTLRMEQ